MTVLDALLEREGAPVREASDGVTNWTAVSPAARKKIGPIVRHYMKDPHPFTACVRDNTKRFGRERAERICAVVKDMGRRTTKWRKGGKVSEAEAEVLRLVAEAAERLKVLDETLGEGAAWGFVHAPPSLERDALSADISEMAFADVSLLVLAGFAEDSWVTGQGDKRPAAPLAEAVAVVGRAERWSPQLKMVASASNEAERHEVYVEGQHVGYVIKRRRPAYESNPREHFQARALNGDDIASNEPTQQAALRALKQHLDEAPSRVSRSGDKWLVAKPSSYGQTSYQEYPSEDAARHAAGLPPRRVVASPMAECDSLVGAPLQEVAYVGSGRRPYDESKHKRAAKGSPGGGRFVSKGSSGDLVRAVQKRVGAKVDGKFGFGTRSAVMSYQRRHGLKVDGVVGRQTAAALTGKKGAKKVKVGSLSAADRRRLLAGK